MYHYLLLIHLSKQPYRFFFFLFFLLHLRLRLLLRSSSSSRSRLLLRNHLLPCALLLRKPRLGDLVRAVQLDALDEQAEHAPEPGDRDVEDPRAAEREGECLEDSLFLLRGERTDEGFVGAGEGAGDPGGQVRAQGGDEPRGAVRHGVLVHDAAEDDGHGGGELSHEAKGRGRGGHVGRVDVRLERDEGRLEERAAAQAGDDLVDDDAGPGGVGLQVDEEAEAQRHHDHAEPDGRQVGARLADEGARRGGDDGQRQHLRQGVHAAQDRRDEEHRLEVQWQVVRGGDEDEGVAEGQQQDDHVVPVAEQAGRHDRVPRQLPLVEYEQHDHHDAEDDQADHRRRVPRVGDAAELEAEEEHDRAADDGDGAEPVDGAEAGQQRGLGRFDLEEEKEDHEGDAADGDCRYKNFMLGGKKKRRKHLV